MSEESWFYADSNQQQQGPISFGEIQQLAASGTIQPSTLIWKEGMASWTAASEVQGVYANPGTQTPGPPAQIPEIPSNPYEAPASANPTAVSSTGSYPIPYVKKCSFALFLSLLIIGAILCTIGLVKFALDVNEDSIRNETQTAQLEHLDSNADTRNYTDSSQNEPPLTGFIIFGFGCIVMVIPMILSYVFLYRAWHILQPGGARTSPGKAVGFMFIPFFSLYWIFVCYHGWAQDWNRIRNSHSNLTSMPTVSEGLFMAGPICMLASIVPFIGFLSALAGGIIILIMLFNICKVVNAMADASQQPN